MSGSDSGHDANRVQLSNRAAIAVTHSDSQYAPFAVLGATRSHLCLGATLCAVLVGALACSPEHKVAHRTGQRIQNPPATGPIWIAWHDTITLQEDSTVINVEPIVRADSGDRFLVADESELQVRDYDHSGELRFAFGDRGDGPSEFQTLAVALRLPSNRILAVQHAARGEIFSPSGDSALTTLQIPLTQIYDADILNDSLVLLSGGVPSFSQGRLSVFDIRTDSVVASFFPPPISPDLGRAMTVVGLTNSAVESDTIATLFALSDTLYLFLDNGRLIRKVQIPFEDYQTPTNPPSGRSASAADFTQWLSKLVLPTNVFWEPDGWLIQYQQRTSSGPIWNLMYLSKEGRPYFDMHHTPLLLLARKRELYFEDPSVLAPDRWIVGTLRRPT